MKVGGRSEVKFVLILLPFIPPVAALFPLPFFRFFLVLI